jgi:hypothetical protein
MRTGNFVCWWVYVKFGRKIGSQSVSQSVSHSVIQDRHSAMQSDWQSCNETVTQTVSLAARRSCSQPFSPSLSQAVTPLIIQAFSQLASHPDKQIASQPVRPSVRQLSLGRWISRLYVRRTLWHFKLTPIPKIMSVLRCRSGYSPAWRCITAVCYCFSNRSFRSFGHCFR